MHLKGPAWRYTSILPLQPCHTLKLHKLFDRFCSLMHYWCCFKITVTAMPVLVLLCSDTSISVHPSFLHMLEKQNCHTWTGPPREGRGSGAIYPRPLLCRSPKNSIARGALNDMGAMCVEKINNNILLLYHYKRTPVHHHSTKLRQQYR